jgi:very-short-patch-repair endonuclease
VRWAARVLDEDAIVAAYANGMSATKVRRTFHVDHQVLRRLLDERGVPVRDKSAAGLTRVQHTPPEAEAERRARISATTRGRPPAPESLVRIAVGKQAAQVKVGVGEHEMIRWLTDRGLAPVGQLAVGKYNLDIAVHPVTVEIHRNAHHPFSRPRTARRVEELAEHGWRSLYVWVTEGRPGFPLVERCADEVVELIDLARRDPDEFGRVRVIRGTGEPAPPARQNSVPSARR